MSCISFGKAKNIIGIKELGSIGLRNSSDGEVELEVGEKTSSILVKELGLSDNSGASKMEMRQSKVGIGVYQLSESLSESSSEEVEKSSPILNKGVDGMSS
ncbi:hypothetical protein V6N11_058698 [Hibiscus sabdariffa]|uniref:Uncharacterized protein n=1 Tax=Hibiscus sabdariffa TaxID=183260 RepID=A0ABR2U594_9ROSI